MSAVSIANFVFFCYHTEGTTFLL